MTAVGTTDESDSRAGDVSASGPWPFVTRRVRQLVDGGFEVWSSRHHRKGYPRRRAGEESLVARCLWNPTDLNWWIGIVFAAGSALFGLGCLFALRPDVWPGSARGPEAANVVFFVGSIPFTMAAYLQLFQAANAHADSDGSGRSFVLIGWVPTNAGWLSCALQFAGTLLFNVNTLDALWIGPDWLSQDLAVWAPDFVGSILFLASGHLALAEACHSHWRWQPGRLSWWIGFVNLLGCIGFMIAAVLSFVPPWPTSGSATTGSLLFTLQGAGCFLLGALLLLPEAVAPDEP